LPPCAYLRSEIEAEKDTAMAMGNGISQGGGQTFDWPAKMSDNIAWALLITTALLIFITMPQLKHAIGGIGPYLMLVVMVGAFIPVLQFFERRWARRDEREAHDPSLSGAFRRDQAALWLLAAGVPLLMAAVLSIAFPGE